MSGDLILLLGGARSGKNAAAERLAQAGRRVLFIATAEALEEHIARRIAAHVKRRPGGWDTLEEPLDPARRAAPILSLTAAVGLRLHQHPKSVRTASPAARACTARARPISPPRAQATTLFNLFCALNRATRRRIAAQLTTTDFPTSDAVPCIITTRALTIPFLRPVARDFDVFRRQRRNC